MNDTLRLKRAEADLKSKKANLRQARRALEEAENVVADWEKAVADAIESRDFIQAQIDHESDKGWSAFRAIISGLPEWDG